MGTRAPREDGDRPVIHDTASVAKPGAVAWAKVGGWLYTTKVYPSTDVRIEGSRPL